jgi:hypothetical protein
VAVYVDDMRAGYRRMVMCHMIADSQAELDAMADRIGVDHKWIQNAGSYREHFDICMSKRILALQWGAVEISQKELGRKLIAKRDPRQGEER